MGNMAEAAWKESYWDEDLVCSDHSEAKKCAMGDGLEICTEEIVSSYGEEARVFMTSLQDFSCDGRRRLEGNSRQLGGHMGGWFDVPCQMSAAYFCRMPKSTKEKSEADHAMSVGGHTAL